MSMETMNRHHIQMNHRRRRRPLFNLAPLEGASRSALARGRRKMEGTGLWHRLRGQCPNTFLSYWTTQLSLDVNIRISYTNISFTYIIMDFAQIVRNNLGNYVDSFYLAIKHENKNYINEYIKTFLRKSLTVSSIFYTKETSYTIHLRS
jgi:hypothetical protein